MKRKFNLKKEFLNSWEYLKESRNFVYAIAAIFLVSVLVGFFVPPSDSLLQQILEILRELLEKTEGMSVGELISFIFFNNLWAGFLGLSLGILLGIFPIVATISNGYLLGFVANLSVESGGLSSLWMILPHGIFELPAIFISFGLGLKLGFSIFKIKEKGFFKKIAMSSLKTFIFIVVPLLFVAAIIEGILIFVSG